MSGGSAAYCDRSVHEHKTRPGDPIRQHILWSYIYIYISRDIASILYYGKMPLYIHIYSVLYNYIYIYI